MTRLHVALVLLTTVACAHPGTAGPAYAKKNRQKARADTREAVLEAMTTELERASKHLTIDDHPPPYYLAYTLRDTVRDDVQARYGAIYQNDRDQDRGVFVEVRVGSYQLDNSGVSSGGFFGTGTKATYLSRKDGPLEDDLDALRASFWLATDEKYKQALSDYLRKKGDRVFAADDKTAPSFSKETPQTHIAAPLPYRLDRAAWAKEARRASQRFSSSPHVFDNLVRVSGEKEVRWIVNSEGTRLITESTRYGVHLNAVARAEDGMLLSHSRSFYGRSEDELPRGKTLDAEVDKLMDELLQLRTAEVIDPFTGPAILAPAATGVLFHEAIGHRLEGERQDDDDSGSTFKGQVGRSVVPTFLTVFDDPTLPAWQGQGLNGAYAFDDEGVPAQRASLIDKGVLAGYLTSRTPVKDHPPESNGHGRAQGNRDPIARMGNLVVETTKGAKEVVPLAELKAQLMAEAKRQGKAYGLIITDIAGGDTNTSSYGYQAFRGVPTLAWRVDAETGEETLVRGFEVVGTPLTVINKIIAASEETDVFNGYCGAESGYVPVSTVAPATLIREVELQRQRPETERAPVLPPPWAKDAGDAPQPAPAK